MLKSFPEKSRFVRRGLRLTAGRNDKWRLGEANAALGTISGALGRQNPLGEETVSLRPAIGAVPPVGMTGWECFGLIDGTASMGRPIRRLVVAGEGQLVRLGAVREHGPNLAGATAGGFKNEVPAVGSPTGAFIAALVASEL